MKSQLLFAVAGLAASLGVACGGSSGSSSGGQCLSTKNSDGQLLLTAKAANNYSFSSSLDISVTNVMPSSELFLDWSGLTKDMVGHAVDPLKDVDMVMMVVWNLSKDQMQQKLNEDALTASYSESAGAYYTSESVTSASIFQFVMPGNSTLLPRDELLARLDPTKFDPATHSYTIMPSKGTTLGHGAKMVKAFALDTTSTNQNIAITSDSTKLTYTADLHSLTPVQIPASQANILADWSSMTVNAMGREFLDRSITTVMVAQYSQTPTELESKFLDLDLIATQMYTGDVPSGDSLLLSALSDSSGNAFTGINSTGTWILALMCGDCTSPAPWYLTVLKTCSSN